MNETTIGKSPRRMRSAAEQANWVALSNSVAARTLSPFGSRFLGRVRENGLGL
jgi:hypothetical protein